MYEHFKPEIFTQTDMWEGVDGTVFTPRQQLDLAHAVPRPKVADMRPGGVFSTSDLLQEWGKPMGATGGFDYPQYSAEWLFPSSWALVEIQHKQPDYTKWNDLPDVIVAGVRAGFVFTLIADNRTDAPAEKWGSLAGLFGYELICTLAKARELLGEPQKAREVEGRSIYDWLHLYDAGEWAYFVNITQIYTPASEWVRWHGIYTYRRPLGGGKV